MALVTPDRFNTLKAKVKSECARRKYTSNGNSVANFADADYDYNIIPASGKVIHQEHKDKLIEPMNAIHDGNGTTGVGIIDDDDLITMETNIIIYENTAIDDHSKTDCDSACTGLCYTTCENGCYTSCTGTCSNQCTTTCTGTCKDGC